MRQRKSHPLQLAARTIIRVLGATGKRHSQEGASYASSRKGFGVTVNGYRESGFKLVSDSEMRGATQSTDTQTLPIRSRQGLGADNKILAQNQKSGYSAVFSRSIGDTLTSASNEKRQLIPGTSRLQLPISSGRGTGVEGIILQRKGTQQSH